MLEINPQKHTCSGGNFHFSFKKLNIYFKCLSEVHLQLHSFSLRGDLALQIDSAGSEKKPSAAV